MTDIKVEWSGEYPCLCFGEWSLSICGIDFSYLIPFKGSANTYGEYERWDFEDGLEKFYTYTDGLKMQDWVSENRTWLKNLPIDESEYSYVYRKFQEHDFRAGSCGGCI